MNRQQVLLALAFKEAGISVSVDTFDERLVVQKSACLLQEAGVHLGYRFRWYLRGPYSPELTSDAFLLSGQHQQVKQELQGWQLDEESKQRIARLKALFFGKSLPALAKHLELLASVMFLIRTRQATATDATRIAQILKINGKPFIAEDVHKALKELGDYGFALG